MQALLDTGGFPVPQSSPARHAAVIVQRLQDIRPSDAGLQQKQDAVERCLVAYLKLERLVCDGSSERWNQGLQLLPQSAADGC